MTIFDALACCTSKDQSADRFFRPRPARIPCDAVPGSEARIDTYRRRLERGENLWHAADRRDHEGLFDGDQLSDQLSGQPQQEMWHDAA